ncbi:ROK family protein [Tautonia plasticadhaerens]|uniref:Glucokinase n=1 Tax=Tautonia plasticadhaerens TaxID=2527974 RepID=A0A518H887_9BACT|nr:ROK family protein [Tautonia plasticadhaerens]QDV37070.1 Glucokinase [Tautonia plasticadhaerens]
MSVKERRPPFYLGIDLGGTNVKSGVVDDDGRSLSSVSLETHASRGPEAGVATLAEAGREAVEASGLSWGEIAGVGLGTPGTMDIPAGMLLEPPNLPGWDHFPVRDRLAEVLRARTILQNDANAAAYGEYWAGAGRGVRSLVLFTMGTGIGGGIVEDGRIIEGRNSHGGECGHIIIQMENGRQCGCGGYGHLEAYASATALVKRAIEALEQSDESTALRRHLAAGTLTARSINEASLANDPLAARLMRETAHYLAVGAVCVMHTINPDLVLFGGGMSNAGPEFIDLIREGVKRMAFPLPASHTKIDYATLGGDAGYIGAAGCARMAFGADSGG